MDQAHLQKLKDDLHHLCENWKRIQTQHVLLDDSAFLSDFASDVQKLDSDLQQAEKVPDYKAPSELIEHLIRTPWGAPFVFDTPLLEAAKSYRGGEEDSKLKRILYEFLHYHDEINEQLFNCIEEIEKKLSA